MSLWAKAQQLSAENLNKIRAIYGEHFPIEVRHYLAQYIEDKFWNEIQPLPDNPQHEQYVAALINNLIQEIENKAAVVTDSDYFLTKLKLAEAAKMFRQRYSGNPMQLYMYIRNCLNTEMSLVHGTNVENVNASMPSNSNTEILHKISYLQRCTQEAIANFRALEEGQESFEITCHQCNKVNAQLTKESQAVPHNQVRLQELLNEKELIEPILNQKVSSLIQLRLTMTDKYKEILQLVSQVQTVVLDDELIKWKRGQQLAGNGVAFNNNLDAIQEWCEALAEISWAARQNIKECESVVSKLRFATPIPEIYGPLLSESTQLISSLVTSTFIIEKQPPQVMKTNTRFTATVRLLVGGKLNVYMNPPQVSVIIISEAQANLMLKNDKLLKSGESCGEILNNTGTMEYHQGTRQLSVSFRNMQLKKIKRAEKKGTESVMDEKFSLLFTAHFPVGGGELVFNVWTLSLPVVVIVHGNQEPHAWATVTWDNAFSDPGRQPFTVPDKITWSKLAETLNMKFKAATGKGLSEENLRFLGDKLFRGNFNESANPMVSWQQFAKDGLNDRPFTFWEWFYAAMKLTREHLRGPWVDGAIIGFVKKKQAEEMLSTCNSGTFLLRFSDSELGGITIAGINESGDVYSVQPFTSKDFGIRPLADRIADLHQLLYLYPETPRDIPFGKYYTPYQDNQPSANNGYVKPVLVTHVPGLSGMSYPNTPSHSFLQSPDSVRDTPSVASSYAGSVATTAPGTSTVDYLDQLDDYQLDLNGINALNFSELIQGYNNKQ